MDTARIAALLVPFLGRPLPAAALEQISIYIDLLVRWNARINLTAIRNPDEIVTRHFGESLFLARQLFLEPKPAYAGADSPAIRVLDIGSGAGFPGLPLKIWAPEIRLTLIESNHKKAAFLREVVRTFTLMDVDVISERAETLAATPAASTADVVTLRAVERFATIIPITVRLLAPAGRLALLIGSGQTAALARLAPTLDWAPPVDVPGSNATVVSIGSRPESGV